MAAIPYPPDTRAKGWRFELDLERIERSDTWALTPADLRPWLLMLWSTAWQQEPCGSLPANDELIAARIGMKTSVFVKNRDKLMRGWWLAEDGRLYHNTIVTRVLEMLAARDKERNRKAEWRDRKKAEKQSEQVPDMSHGTTSGQTWESHGSDDTGTGTGTGTGSKPKTVGTNTDGGTPSRTSTEDGFLTAAGISMSLIGWERERGKAARNMTPSQQQVIDLAGMQVTAAELRKAYDAAVADRLATNDPAPVNAGFVRAKLEGVRRPPVKREDNSWKRTPAGIERKASELGVVCPPGRDHAWLLEKCESVMRQRAREVAA
ncbi:TPA: hypothetical protein QDB46_000220 [Burkholderia multivorans]|nr:hypothetical protein [Burkholderia multivorans]HDR9292535.1 hypothetical protein [Burkholderia multivorans]HDR9296550.1 hypothetical protein [Burkholderia multivorans]HDR9302421.1 hypothetical protein [Burkholderia multivorans]HDR9308015.1 hypothetical protein [Burkholderia multivorans]